MSRLFTSQCKQSCNYNDRAHLRRSTWLTVAVSRSCPMPWWICGWSISNSVRWSPRARAPRRSSMRKCSRLISGTYAINLTLDVLREIQASILNLNGVLLGANREKHVVRDGEQGFLSWAKISEAFVVTPTTHSCLDVEKQDAHIADTHQTRRWKGRNIDWLDRWHAWVRISRRKQNPMRTWTGKNVTPNRGHACTSSKCKRCLEATKGVKRLPRNLIFASLTVIEWIDERSSSWIIAVHSWGRTLRNFNTVAGRRCFTSRLGKNIRISRRQPKTYIEGRSTCFDARYCRAAKYAISS